MSLDRDTVQQRIQHFLQQDAPQRKELETVVLCGSHAEGRAAEHSDIDLCYIGEFPAFQRESRIFSQQEFQLMIAPWSWYEEVVRSYERKGNIGTITTMLAKGICIRGDGPKWRKLHDLAKRYYKAGPAPASADAIRRLRVQITGAWKDYCDKEGEPSERAWLGFHIVQTCLQAHFAIKGWWAVKTKHQLAELRRKDAALAALVDKCIASSGSDRELLRSLCMYVLEPVGGWMNESWKSGT